MATMRRVAVLLALAAAGPAGCRGGGAEAPARADRIEVSAGALLADYGALRGRERLEKYGNGVVVDGVVDEVVELGESEGLHLSLAVEGGRVELAFADGGARAHERGVAEGQRVAARCRVAGRPAETLYLADCVLR